MSSTKSYFIYVLLLHALLKNMLQGNLRVYIKIKLHVFSNIQLIRNHFATERSIFEFLQN